MFEKKAPEVQVIVFKVPSIEGSNIICPLTCEIYDPGFFQNQQAEGIWQAN